MGICCKVEAVVKWGFCKVENIVKWGVIKYLVLDMGFIWLGRGLHVDIYYSLTCHLSRQRCPLMAAGR